MPGLEAHTSLQTEIATPFCCCCLLVYLSCDACPLRTPLDAELVAEKRVKSKRASQPMWEGLWMCVSRGTPVSTELFKPAKCLFLHTQSLPQTTFPSFLLPIWKTMWLTGHPAIILANGIWAEWMWLSGLAFIHLDPLSHGLMWKKCV